MVTCPTIASVATLRNPGNRSVTDQCCPDGLLVTLRSVGREPQFAGHEAWLELTSAA